MNNLVDKLKKVEMTTLSVCPHCKEGTVFIEINGKMVCTKCNQPKDKVEDKVESA